MGFSPPVQTLVMPSGQPSEREGKSGVALGPEGVESMAGAPSGTVSPQTWSGC